MTGQIINAFAQIRAKAQGQEQDNKDKCFVCSMERHTFEKTGEGFAHHTTRDHHPMNYLWYLVGIKLKDECDITGAERMVNVRADSINSILT